MGFHLKKPRRVTVAFTRYEELLQKERIADANPTSELLLELFRGKCQAEEEVRQLKARLFRIQKESEGV